MRSLRGNAKGFALSFPKPQTDAPGWRAYARWPAPGHRFAVFPPPPILAGRQAAWRSHARRWVVQVVCLWGTER